MRQGDRDLAGAGGADARPVGVHRAGPAGLQRAQGVPEGGRVHEHVEVVELAGGAGVQGGGDGGALEHRPGQAVQGLGDHALACGTGCPGQHGAREGPRSAQRAAGAVGSARRAPEEQSQETV